MSDTTLKISFEGDDPRRSSSPSTPAPQTNPAGARPVQSSVDELQATHEAIGLASEGEAGMAAFTDILGAGGTAAAGAEGAAALGGGAAAAGAGAAGAAAGGAGAAAGAAAAGAGGAAGGAAAGAAMGLPGGPPGMAIGAIIGGLAFGAMSDEIDMVIQGFTALYDSAMALDDTMMSIVDDIKAFSMPVAQADAMYKIEEMMAMINRADVLGSDTAEYLSARSDINVAITDLNTTLASLVLPLIAEGTEDLAAIIKLISNGVKYLTDVVSASGVVGSISKNTGAVVPILSHIHDYLQNLQRLEGDKKSFEAAEKLNALLAGTTGFGGGPPKIGGRYRRGGRGGGGRNPVDPLTGRKAFP